MPPRCADELRALTAWVIDASANWLKKALEGDGKVFDNTMIFYFPDNGETHHSHGTEYPAPSPKE